MRTSCWKRRHQRRLLKHPTIGSGTCSHSRREANTRWRSSQRRSSSGWPLTMRRSVTCASLRTAAVRTSLTVRRSLPPLRANCVRRSPPLPPATFRRSGSSAGSRGLPRRRPGSSPGRVRSAREWAASCTRRSRPSEPHWIDARRFSRLSSMCRCSTCCMAPEGRTSTRRRTHSRHSLRWSMRSRNCGAVGVCSRRSCWGTASGSTWRRASPASSAWKTR